VAHSAETVRVEAWVFLSHSYVAARGGVERFRHFVAGQHVIVIILCLQDVFALSQTHTKNGRSWYVIT
jgi:hypothetical protein